MTDVTTRIRTQICKDVRDAVCNVEPGGGEEDEKTDIEQKEDEDIEVASADSQDPIWTAEGKETGENI